MHSLSPPIPQAASYAQAVREAVDAVQAEAADAAPAPRLLLLDLNKLMSEWSPPAPPGSGGVALGEAPAWHALLSDGLHLSPEGNELLFDALARLIAERAPDIAPDALTLDFPLWRDVDNASSAASAESLSAAALSRLHEERRPW